MSATTLFSTSINPRNNVVLDEHQSGLNKKHLHHLFLTHTNTMATMQRVVVTRFDPSDILSTLEVHSAPVPVPKDGEILVKMTMRPINPADIFSIMGVYPGFAPAQLPACPGLEGCGEIADANGCAGMTAGMRGVVFCNTKDGQGSWQEFVAVSASAFLPVPASCSDSSAAQFLVNPVTVVGMLDALAAPEGEYILQSAAGSVLGRQLITLAKKRGLKTINLIRRAAQGPELLAHGADHVICTEEEDVVARVKEITDGKGAWGACEAVAGDLTEKVTASVRVGGTVIIYGAMSGIEFKGSVVDVLFRNVTIRGFWLNIWLSAMSVEQKSDLFASILGMLSDGTCVPMEGQTFELKDIRAAVAHAQAPARGGKTLLR